MQDDSHPIVRILDAQGRRQTWLARQLGISWNYFHRILLGANHPDGRPAPEWFYERCADKLGVPQSMLLPAEPAPREEAA